MVLSCIEVKRFEKTCFPAQGYCNTGCNDRLTQFSDEEVGNGIYKNCICALSCAPPRFGLLLYCRRFVQCTKVWKQFNAIMEVFCCFTVAIGFFGEASDYNCWRTCTFKLVSYCERRACYLHTVVNKILLVWQPVRWQPETSPWPGSKCVRFGAGRSRVRLLAGSYQDLVNWYCRLLTRRTVYGRAAVNTPRTQHNTKPEICTNSVVALHDHCSYTAPATNHHIKKMTAGTASSRCLCV